MSKKRQSQCFKVHNRSPDLVRENTLVSRWPLIKEGQIGTLNNFKQNTVDYRHNVT